MNGERGKVITVIVVAGIFVALMTGAYFVIKMFTQTGEQYGQALIHARQTSYDTGCKLQMTNINTTLRTAAESANGKFPPSMTEFYSINEFHCPDPNGPAYQYIPGQDESMPAGNVLVYEATAAHEGKCTVLRLSGRVEFLTPEQVQAAVEQTRRVIAARRRPRD
ncbi:MAG: hypothetical protein ABSH10_02780 [Phycisphaerae bacterium]|jgi:hypothetical protein